MKGWVKGVGLKKIVITQDRRNESEHFNLGTGMVQESCELGDTFEGKQPARRY